MKDPKNNNPNEIAGAERIKTKRRDRTQDEAEEWSHSTPWLLDEFPCAVWRSDKDGKCDYVNRAWLDLRGRTIEQELGDGWTEGVHPDDLDSCLRTYLDAFNARQAFEIEYRLRGQDGEYRWMTDCGRPFNDLEGNFAGYVGTCFDTTERKQAEESRRLFRSLLDRSSDAIEVIDPDTLRFLDCNQSACQSLGYSRKEFLALSVFDIDAKIDESMAAAVVAEMKRSGFAMFESIHRRKDGSTFPVEVNVRVIQLDRAYPLAIVRDITERKQAEERLREYERVVEGLEEMIVVIDRDYRYLVANRAFLNNRGLERDQVIGHYVSEVLDPETFEKIVKQKLIECFQGRVVKYELKCFYPKLGERDLLISYFPIEGPGGVEQAACILRDITESKRAEDALREAEHKYREIFENADEGIFQSTPDGRFISANPALARMHGFDSPEDLIRSRDNISRQVYVDSARREEFKRLLDEHRIICGFEHQAFRKDGSKIWISVNARAVSDKLGAILYYEGTAQDISERKRAEARSAAFAALARKLSGVRTPLEAGRIVARTASDLWEWDFFDLNLYEADRDLVHSILNIDTIDGRRTETTAPVSVRKPTARSRRVIAHGSELRLRDEPIQFDTDAMPFGDKTRPSASIMTVPIRHADTVVGLLSIQSYTSHTYDTAALADLEALADHCGEALNRIQAEKSLHESEERYRDLVENSRELICTHDLDGRVLSANRAAAEALGYEPDEFVGKISIRDILAPEVRDQFDEYMARLSTDGVTSGLMLVETSSGERRMWDYYNSLRTEGVDTPIVRGVAHDVTEQRCSEKAMSDLRRELELTMSSMEEGVHRVNLQGDIVFENQAAGRMLGWEVSELLGKCGHTTMHHTRPDGTPYPREECPVYATFSDGVSRHVTDEVFWRRDGTSFPVEYKTAPMRNDQNEIVATVVTFSDITEQRRAEKALRQSEERYRELFENAKDAIYVHDLSGRYTSVNRAAEQLSGFAREEILGKHFSNFVSPRDLKHVRTNLCQKLDLENETIYEVDLVTRSGRRVPVEVSSRLIFENGVAVGVQGTARDITDRKRAQEGLRIYSQRLIQAQEAEREKIARELHDEIGQVLTAVRINLQSMQRSGGKNENGLRLDESIAVVDEALGRVRELSIELRPSLLDDLGLTAALRWYVERYAQRTGIIAEVLNGFEEAGRLSRELETVCFRIAQEALTNAARHAQAASISVQLERSREEMLLTIIDDGVGFDFEKLKKNASAASALGLRGMEERAFTVGGHIEIDSGPGRGTRVRATFPLRRR